MTRNQKNEHGIDRGINLKKKPSTFNVNAFYLIGFIFLVNLQNDGQNMAFGDMKGKK